MISPSTRARIRPRAADRLEDVEVLPLPSANQGRQEQNFPPGRKRHHVSGHLLGRLAMDEQPALRAMGRAQLGEKQPEVVINFRDRADRAPRAGLAWPLVDGHGGRKALDQVDLGPLELIEELPGVAGKTLDVAPLSLGENGVKRQRAFPRPAHPREHDEPIAGDVQIHGLKIVRARTANHDGGRRIKDARRGRHSALSFNHGSRAARALCLIHPKANAAVAPLAT